MKKEFKVEFEELDNTLVFVPAPVYTWEEKYITRQYRLGFVFLKWMFVVIAIIPKQRFR
jgi:hypothetical protein